MIRIWFLLLLGGGLILALAVPAILTETTRVQLSLAPQGYWYVRLGILGWYFGGSLVLIEMMSFLSRGYSLRVILDIKRLGGMAEAASLTEMYGDGMGLEGLLRKRLAGLVALGFAPKEGEMIGPLSKSGRMAAKLARGARRILNLGEVG